MLESEMKIPVYYQFFAAFRPGNDGPAVHPLVLSRCGHVKEYTMTHHDRNWTFALLCFAASLLLSPCCFAQVPGFARSEGRFAVNTERCLDQASVAFKSRGFTVTDVFAETHVVFAKSDINRSEEHTSELQSLRHLVCRLLLEKK